MSRNKYQSPASPVLQPGIHSLMTDMFDAGSWMPVPVSLCHFGFTTSHVSVTLQNFYLVFIKNFVVFEERPFKIFLFQKNLPLKNFLCFGKDFIFFKLWCLIFWNLFSVGSLSNSFLEQCRYEFHQIWQIWSKLAETEFWKFWKEKEWIKMVLGCGYKGLSRRVGLGSKLKCNMVLALKIIWVQNNFQICFERKNN